MATSRFAALKEPPNQFGLNMRATLIATALCGARRARGLTMRPLIFTVGI